MRIWDQVRAYLPARLRASQIEPQVDSNRIDFIEAHLDEDSMALFGQRRWPEEGIAHPRTGERIYQDVSSTAPNEASIRVRLGNGGVETITEADDPETYLEIVNALPFADGVERELRHYVAFRCVLDYVRAPENAKNRAVMEDQLLRPIAYIWR
ncbi:MAG: hypothetical protein JWN03_1171 [Nocardia sp.]|uniref:hypothetical protein n=1 Tax=Nocardia sp. TaxID=1821 RepID=UPI0026021EDE|nr:hypothetical protein [Nocardia sp.]MCU1640896.1 hypothetical protein [Nocardia sp.]